jgi:hypothetical protein
MSGAAEQNTTAMWATINKLQAELNDLKGRPQVNYNAWSPTFTPWYLAGGIPLGDCVGAYQAIGAPSLSVSYTNLAHPGSHNLTLGTAPSLNPVYGWVFTGTQYLKTGIIVNSSNWSAIIRFSNGNNQYPFGAYISATQAFAICPLRSGTDLRFLNQGELLIGAAGTNLGGVDAIAGRKGYLNGTQQAGNIAVATTPNIEIYIGGLNQSGVLGGAWVGEIAAIAFYDIPLTQAQITAVTNAMNGLVGLWTNPVAGSIDVSTGTTATYEQYASRLPHQRCSFCAAGLHWLFWGDYTATFNVPTEQGNINFRSSADGITWSGDTTLTKTFRSADANWEVCYDEVNNKVWVIKNIGSTNSQDGVEVRRGTPLSNGTITWDTAWITAIAVGAGIVGDMSSCVDTGGHLWIVGGNAGAPTNNAVVWKNANTDGTWATAAGFPVTLTASGDGRFPIIAPLNSGGVYVAVYKWNATIPATGYYSATGTNTFVSDGNITTNSLNGNLDVLAQLGHLEIDSFGGVVHLVYHETSPASKARERVWYKSRSTGGVWSSETIIGMNTWPQGTSPRLSFDPSGNIYVTWTGYNLTDLNLYCAKCISGVWTPETWLVHGDSVQSGYEHAMVERYIGDGKFLLSYLRDDYTLIAKLIDTSLL